MKISPLIFLLSLGLIVLPEKYTPSLPFGRADAAVIPIYAEHIKHNNHSVSEQNPVWSPLECDACQYLAIGLNQTILHNSKVVAFVATDIEKVCSLLPESVQETCNNAAQSVAPVVINDIGNFIASDGCIYLGICH
jgi:hypothetical protein